MYGPPLLISTPSLVQVWVSGGPPLVLHSRVKVGLSVRKEEESNDSWVIEITPTENQISSCTTQSRPLTHSSLIQSHRYSSYKVPILSTSPQSIKARTPNWFISATHKCRHGLRECPKLIKNIIRWGQRDESCIRIVPSSSSWWCTANKTPNNNARSRNLNLMMIYEDWLINRTSIPCCRWLCCKGGVYTFKYEAESVRTYSDHDVLTLWRESKQLLSVVAFYKFFLASCNAEAWAIKYIVGLFSRKNILWNNRQLAMVLFSKHAHCNFIPQQCAWCLSINSKWEWFEYR